MPPLFLKVQLNLFNVFDKSFLRQEVPSLLAPEVAV